MGESSSMEIYRNKSSQKCGSGTRGAVYVMLCHFIMGSASAVLQLQAFHAVLVADVHCAVSQYDISGSPVKVHLKGCVNINVK